MLVITPGEYSPKSSVVPMWNSAFKNSTHWAAIRSQIQRPPKLTARYATYAHKPTPMTLVTAKTDVVMGAKWRDAQAGKRGSSSATWSAKASGTHQNNCWVFTT